MDAFNRIYFYTRYQMDLRGKSSVGVKKLWRILTAISECDGTDENCFKAFKTECLNLLQIVGLKYEMFLINFIKDKLTGKAQQLRSLECTSLYHFFEESEAILLICPDHVHDPHYWKDKMSSINRNIFESVHQYGMRLEGVLDDALRSVKCKRFQQNIELNQKVNYSQDFKFQAQLIFERNLRSKRLRMQLRATFLRARSLRECISAAVKIEEHLMRDSTCKLCYGKGHRDIFCYTMPLYHPINLNVNFIDDNNGIIARLVPYDVRQDDVIFDDFANEDDNDIEDNERDEGLGLDLLYEEIGEENNSASDASTIDIHNWQNDDSDDDFDAASEGFHEYMNGETDSENDEN